MFDTCFEYDDYLRANGTGPVGRKSGAEQRLYRIMGKVAPNPTAYVKNQEQLGAFSFLSRGT